MSIATASDEPSFPANEPPSRAGRWFWRALAKFIVVVLIIAAGVSSVLFVDESEYVVVETLGRIVAVYDNVDTETGDRGLHFKWPWPIGTVRRFDRRQQLFDPPGREMLTRDKKNITISSYVCWKIAEPPVGQDGPLTDQPVVKFFRGLGNLSAAELRLDARVRSILATEIGQIELSQLLTTPNSEAGPTGDSPIAAVSARALDQIRHRGDEQESLLDKLGVHVVDLRIKRINLPEGNRFAVYERMRTERERIAERYRSAGRAEKTRIESQARRQSDELLARAAADAERIRGDGEAEAIGILNRAHAQDPEFYEYQRTLAGYSKILNERTTLVLSASNKLLKVLTEGIPNSPSAKQPEAKPNATTAAKGGD